MGHRTSIRRKEERDVPVFASRCVSVPGDKERWLGLLVEGACVRVCNHGELCRIRATPTGARADGAGARRRHRREPSLLVGADYDLTVAGAQSIGFIILRGPSLCAEIPLPRTGCWTVPLKFITHHGRKLLIKDAYYYE